MSDDPEPAAPPIDLSTATREELWKELKKRYRSCILVFEEEHPGVQGDQDYSVNFLAYTTFAERMGLAEYLHRFVKAEHDHIMRKSFESKDEEGDD